MPVSGIQRPQCCGEHILQYVLVSAALGFLSEGLSGWNAFSLPNGVVIFNYDLVLATWAVASAYIRLQHDARFAFDDFLKDVAYKVMHGISIMPEAGLPYQMRGQVSQLYVPMLAFVAGHEIAHFARYHLLQTLAVGGQGGSRTGVGGQEVDDLRAMLEVMRLSQEFELEADGLALNYMAASGRYDPATSLVSLYFMQVLESYIGRKFSAADTHPSCQTRFLKAQQWLLSRGYRYHL